MNAQVEEIIQDVLDSCLREDPNQKGYYIYEVYVDYRDTFSKETVIKIFNENLDPSEYVENFFSESDSDYDIGDVLDKINEQLSDEGIDEDEDEIRDYLYEHVSTKYPIDHYVDESVCTNIVINTGDANWDFSINNIGPHYCACDEISDNSALVWLVKQQGYTKEQFEKAMDDPDSTDSPFLKSIYTELLNCSSSMNALTFFISISIKDLYELRKNIEANNALDDSDLEYTPSQRTGTGYIVLSKDINCGLFDSWDGAGSVLEIELEKDVEIPMKYIWKAEPDGATDHGVDSVYSMCSDFWDGEILRTEVDERTKQEKE